MFREAFFPRSRQITTDWSYLELTLNDLSPHRDDGKSTSARDTSCDHRPAGGV